MSTVTPQKPWAISAKDRSQKIAIFLASAIASYLVVAATPAKGKLAYIALFAIFFSIASGVLGWSKFGRRAAADALIQTVIGLLTFITLMPIASILATVISKGYKGLTFNLFKTDMSLNAPTDPINVGGLLHAITGTFILVGIALILSVPLGILTALYITEVKGRFTKPIKFLVQAMSGVPSIVAGLFILSAILYPITKSYSGFMGSLALTILMIPTIARTSEEVLKLIPNELREAGVALGGTQWRTVAMIVLPAARSGLMTAMILGVARIAGETAPLLLLTGGGDKVNPNPFKDPMGSLPYYIWKSFNAGSPEAITRAWAGLLVLLIIVFILFTSARLLFNSKGQVMTSPLTEVANSQQVRVPSLRAAGTGLEARGVHAWFTKHHALADVSLDFAPGTVTALIGPSGCGKSTFIRTLNRMHEFIPGAAMAGEVLLDGKDVYAPGVDVTKIRLQIGMVFQKPNPFPSMTIGENVLSGLKLAQIKVENKDDLLEECLERAGLWKEVKDRLGAYGGSLSGGQQQRLCIARALAVRPQVLLMDEPCSALDPGSTLRIEETIRQLSDSMTIVIVTHNMQQAARVSDYTAFFLSDGGPGQMVEVAPTAEIFSRPKDKRTEDYVTGRFG